MNDVVARERDVMRELHCPHSGCGGDRGLPESVPSDGLRPDGKGRVMDRFNGKDADPVFSDRDDPEHERDPETALDARPIGTEESFDSYDEFDESIRATPGVPEFDESDERRHGGLGQTPDLEDRSHLDLTEQPQPIRGDTN